MSGDHRCELSGPFLYLHPPSVWSRCCLNLSPVRFISLSEQTLGGLALRQVRLGLWGSGLWWTWERERFTVVVLVSAVFWFPFFEWRTQTISTCWFGELTPLSCRNIRASWPSAVVFVVCSGAEAQETWGDTAVGVHHLRFTAVDLVSAGPKLSCVFFC